MTSVISNSPEETAGLGEIVGRLVQSGMFIALLGDLGAGKTHFVQGLARGLGVPPEICVSSPSYTLLNEYAGRVPLYHFDLYRLVGDSDILDLGFEEYFYGTGVCVVEWADRLLTELPTAYVRIRIIDNGASLRTIEVSGVGETFEAWVDRLALAWEKRV